MLRARGGVRAGVRAGGGQVTTVARQHPGTAGSGVDAHPSRRPTPYLPPDMLPEPGREDGAWSRIGVRVCLVNDDHKKGANRKGCNATQLSAGCWPRAEGGAEGSSGSYTASHAGPSRTP